MKKFKDELSIRSIDGLARCFGRQALDAPEIITKAGAKRLRLVIWQAPYLLYGPSGRAKAHQKVVDWFAFIKQKIGVFNM